MQGLLCCTLAHRPVCSHIEANCYLEPFKADKRKPVGLAIELDDTGNRLVGWKAVH